MTDTNVSIGHICVMTSSVVITMNRVMMKVSRVAKEDTYPLHPVIMVIYSGVPRC